MQTYVFRTEVTVTAPQGFKPRNKVHIGVGISDKENAMANVERKAIDLLRQSYEKQYPGLEMKYKARSTRINQDFFVIDMKQPTVENKDQE